MNGSQDSNLRTASINQASKQDDQSFIKTYIRLPETRWVKLSLNFELLVNRVMKFLLGQRLFKHNNNIKVTFRCHSSDNINFYLQELSQVNWGNVLVGDVHEQVEIFQNVVNTIYCKSCPLKIKYVSQKRLDNPWLTSGILKSIKMKSFIVNNLNWALLMIILIRCTKIG